jgi:hypothetical protein
VKNANDKNMENQFRCQGKAGIEAKATRAQARSDPEKNLPDPMIFQFPY